MLYKTTPFAHQVTCVNFVDKRRWAGILGEMGTGKTKILIDDAARCWAEKKIDGLLVTAPNDIHTNWVVKEIPTHLADEVPRKMWLWSSKLTAKQRDALFNDCAKPFDGLRILAVNIESLPTTAGQELIEQFLKSGRMMWAVDESTRIKNGKAMRTKVALRLAKYAVARRIMSGLPTPKSPLDMYTQLEFLAPGLSGHKSFYTFQARYAQVKRINKTKWQEEKRKPIPGRDYYDKITGYQRIDELASLVAAHCFRILKKDCLDLPPKVYATRTVQLEPEQRKIYDGLKANAMVELQTGMLSAPLVITRLMRLQQITGGYAPQTQPDGTVLTGAREIVPVDRNPKLQALIGVVEETSEKVIIWARFLHEVRTIVAALSDLYGAEAVLEYTGETASDLKTEQRRRFQEDDTARYFVGTMAGGIGITLTAAGVVVYYSNLRDLEARAQSEDRAHRIGQKKTVTYVDIVADDTLDLKILDELVVKKQLAALVTRDDLTEFIG